MTPPTTHVIELNEFDLDLPQQVEQELGLLTCEGVCHSAINSRLRAMTLLGADRSFADATVNSDI